jgi:serine/arginine repetitive matrix protein 1
MRPWVAKTVTDLVGFEDDIVVEYAMGLLEDPDNPVEWFSKGHPSRRP